jgi:hypothetical protein
MPFLQSVTRNPSRCGIKNRIWHQGRDLRGIGASVSSGNLLEAIMQPAASSCNRGRIVERERERERERVRAQE